MPNEPQLSDEELLTGLSDLAARLNKRPTQKEMRLEGPYSINAYKRAFGSWNGALEAAGFDPNRRGRPVTQDQLVESLRALADELGRSPSQADINEHSPHSHKTYYRKFDGGLAEAKERAGVEIYEQNTRKRVTVECDNCGAELERTPSDVENKSYHYCDRECLGDHRAELYAGENNPSWNSEAVDCAHCGELIYRDQWELENKQEHYCSDCWGNVTVEVECAWCGDVKELWPSLARSEKHFCDRRCHGRWNTEHNTGENHPRWRPGKRPSYYGPNWPKQRQTALLRDQYRCQDCGVTDAAYRRETGETLSVHHITPFREFETSDSWNHEAANRLDNLVSVCRQCHIVRENRLD